jgi:hypothetical protein
MADQLRETGRSTATAYHFRGRGGWAICTVNDATGELLIVSDWTDGCGFRWHTAHLGCPTLTEFLAHDRGGHYDYLVGERFSADETVKAMRERVLHLRRDGELTRGEARATWEALDDLRGCNDDREFFEGVFRLDSGGRDAFPEPWEFARMVRTRDAWALDTFILPALAAACQRELERRQLAAAHGPQVPT